MKNINDGYYNDILTETDIIIIKIKENLSFKTCFFLILFSLSK